VTELTYRSTRGYSEKFSAAQAILKGIAPDGGLFVPSVIPSLPTPLDELATLNYQELAFSILELFLTDYTKEELWRAINGAYDHKFVSPDVAPVIEHGGVRFLELFHGPTLAFKDMALSILPYLMTMAAEKIGLGKEVVILTATSGDTGKAALEGFAGVDGTHIIVFYPEHGVSQVQKRQMVTQSGDNTYVIGIEGNFDDAQSAVKAMFTNRSLIEAVDQKGYVFSSANSINIGRLIPQVVYYYWAYLKSMADGVIQAGEALDFAVPTGNFGNILAGYYAKQMGLPIGKLICASNENKVLYDFFTTGTYDRGREFYVTMSPSMDILISSNLERLLWHISGEASEEVAKRMEQLTEKGGYEITKAMRENLADFAGGYATEKETAAAIRELFEQSGYLMDTHTAVAYAVRQLYSRQTGSSTPAVVVSTASPYKFTKDVMQAIDTRYATVDDFALIAEMEKRSGMKIPEAIKGLDTRPVLHKRVCQKDELQRTVEDILQL
jgi:threonine synthase